MRHRVRRRVLTGESGAVTAEAAMVLPTLALVAVALVWLVSAGIAQVRVVDAAREGARALARGEPEAVAQSLAARVAPSGARMSTSADDRTVTVRVTAKVRGPGGVFGAVPAMTVRAQAVAAREPED